jgi:MFS superfamily sulfate permease-like transporter
VDSNRELLANGAANAVGAFFQALPAAGGFSQSAVNQKAGARSQLAAVVTVVLAVLIALFLAPVLDNLPQATLASMVFVAVIGLIDVPGLVRLARISRLEFWIAVVTAAIGLAAGLLPAVAAGVVFTLGAVLHELGKPHFDVRREGATLVVSLQLSLYTASVLPTERAIEALLDADPGIRTLVIDAGFMRSASVTVLDALAEFDHELAERDVRLEVRGLGGDALQLAKRTEWWATMEREGRAGAITSIG